MATAIEMFTEGATEPFPGTPVIRSYRSNVSGEVSGVLVVPDGSDGVIVRFRLRNELTYASTNYVIADDSTDQTDEYGNVLREFTIPGLTPGQTYAILAQAVDTDGKAISIPSREHLVVVTGGALSRGSYLPIDVLEYTEFPKANGKDVYRQIAMIEDVWARQMPKVEFYNAKKFPTASLDEGGEVDPNVLSGEEGTTKYDPLWGERVSDSVANGGAWVQPHGKEDHSVNGRGVFEVPVLLPCQIERIQKERQMKKYGFDEVREIVATIPVSFLDRFGVKVEAGDKFVWDGEQYEVKQERRDGWWMNSNVRLYVVMACDHWRPGS